MFNYQMKLEDNLVFYNSFKGTSSICCVSSETAPKVAQWLAEKKLSAVDDPDFITLCEKGFFIPETTNEHNKRSLLYAKYVCDPVLSLVIHTTKDCNFRCQYCYLDFQNKPVSGEVRESIIKFIQKYLYRFSSVRISWCGGEPLLGMDTIEYISQKVMHICEKAKKTYYSSITTNGYLLTPQNIEKLIQCKVTSYTITIDGLANTHDNLRFLKGKYPTFDRIIANLLHIKNNVKCSSLRVVIRTNLTKEISKHIDEYYTFYNETFGDDKRFSLFVRPVRDAGGERVKEISSDLLTNQQMDQVLLKLADKVQTGGITFLSNDSELQPAGYTCPAICVGKYTIDVEGKVSKCDSVEESLAIGQLDKDGNLQLCGTNEDDWMTGCFKYEPECEDCFFSATCFKGTCPIGRTIDCKLTCKMRTDEIHALLRLYLATEKPNVIL